MWPYCLLPLSTSYFLSRWKPGDLSHLPITITYPACIQTRIFCPPSCYAQKWVLLLPGPSPPLGAASFLLSFTQGFCFIPLFLQHWQFPPLCRIILIYITVCFIISHLSCWPISLPSLVAKLFKSYNVLHRPYHVVVQWLSCVRLLEIPCTAAHQAS